MKDLAEEITKKFSSFEALAEKKEYIILLLDEEKLKIDPLRLSQVWEIICKLMLIFPDSFSMRNILDN